MVCKIFLIFLLISLASAQTKKCREWQYFNQISKTCKEKSFLNLKCTDNDECDTLFCIKTNSSVNKLCQCDPSIYL